MKDKSSTFTSPISATPTVPAGQQTPDIPSATNPRPLANNSGSPPDDAESQSVESGLNIAAQPTAETEANFPSASDDGNDGDDGDDEEDNQEGETQGPNASASQPPGALNGEPGSEDDAAQTAAGPLPSANTDPVEVEATDEQERPDNEDGEKGEDDEDVGAVGAGEAASTSAGAPAEPVTTTQPDGVVATTFPTGNNFSGDASDLDQEEDFTEDEDDDGTGDDSEDQTQPGEPVGEDQGSPSEDAGNGLSDSSNTNDSGTSIGERQVGVIAGGVVGGISAIAFVVFLIWFFKKRARDRKHQYVIHTPVMENSRSGGPGNSWDSDNDSASPNGLHPKMAEAIGSRAVARGSRIRASSPYGDPGADAERRSVQFYNSPSRRDRDSQISPEMGELSAKDRIGDWWSKMREDANNWRLRNGDVTEIVGSSAYNGRPNEGAGPRRTMSDMNDGQRFSRTIDGQRFSGALGVMVNDARGRGNDPFSDNQEAAWDSAHSNPFDDSNQVAPPSAAAGATVYNPTRPLTPQRSATGDAGQPRGSTPPNRTNAKSDQFDLDIYAGPAVSKPSGAHTRQSSYTSDVSNLSDDHHAGPGPDVGRTTVKWADGTKPGPAVKSPQPGQGTWPLLG